jgi:hypothetical protein
MAHTESVEKALAFVRRLWEKGGSKGYMRYAAFCLSLVPIPAMQEAFQILDRLLSDADSAKKFQDVWNELARLNARVDELDFDDSIVEVAKTVASNPQLHPSVAWVLDELGAGSTFRAVAETGGIQTLIDTLVEAESAQFIASSGGKNILHGVSVRSQNTLLQASGDGQNFVSSAEFVSPNGAVTFSNVSTHGAVQMSGASIRLSANSGMSFGGRRMVRQGVCPNCNKPVEFELHEIQGKSVMPCPHCGALGNL